MKHASECLPWKRGIGVLAWCLLAASVPPRAAAAPGTLEARARSEYARKAFKEVLPYLDGAAALYERQDSLPARTWFFGENKRSNEADINKLLDRAVQVLGVSEAGDFRGKIRALEARIAKANASISEYKEKRISAPLAQDSTSKLDQFNPFHWTRDDYDEKIAEAKTRIEADQEEITKLRIDFAESLRATGINVSDEAAESLLATVPGDDFISMCVVFDNLKLITLMLHELTDESGEDPDTAKRYYGMYVIIAKTLDRVQTQYLLAINERYLPALGQLAKKARNNIAEAKRLIRSNGGDRDALESNIGANEITLDAAAYYVEYLQEMSEIIEKQHKETRRILVTAANTYKTVDVSVNVGELIINGSKNLDKLMQLKMPQLRAFTNEILKREYQRLDARMRDAS